MHEHKGKQGLTDGASPSAGVERERQQVKQILEDWAEPFLLAQHLERTAGRVQRPLFHSEPGMQPTFNPGRAIIWPLELEPLWHLILLRLTMERVTGD